MARKPRIEYENAFYHVICRGNNRQKIYLDKEDYKTFLKYLKETKDRFFLKIYGYTLMDNHFHQLIETPEGNLSISMQSLLTRYARYFNKRHKKVGHLFQGRYKAIICQKNGYFMELVRYIHLNPIRAKIVKDPAEWTWSGYRSLLGLDRDGLVETGGVLSYFGNTVKTARENFVRFMSEGKGIKHCEEYYKVADGRILGDERFIEKIKMKMSESVRQSNRAFLGNISFDKLARDICNELKIKDIKRKVKERKISFARQVFSYISRKYLHKRVKDIANFLSQELSAISQGIRRFEVTLKKDKSKKKFTDAFLKKLSTEK